MPYEDEPMPVDGLITLQTLVTGTTASISGATYNTLTGTPRRGVKVRFLYSASSAATVGAVLTPSVQKSSNGTAWVAHVTGDPITLTTAAQSNEQFLPVNVTRDFPFIQTLVAVAPTTGLPSWVVQADYSASQP
jgi:hypothetical protein